ncbi:cold shock domain-containing protein [Devosia sp. XGJD_8]|uniref:cold shock domain-containing protein n=1 Tax=Devosia sp. XGJD_8 TaxID=3391187 RepID=UPI003984A745
MNLTRGHRMKPLKDITFGFSDAENYKRRENRELFNKIFLRTDALDEICEPNIFFLVGEKGTGKTAYAVHFSNTTYRENRSFHKFIRETDYLKFISLKNDNRLELSDYTSIWKVIVYLLMAKEIDSDSGLVRKISSGWKYSAIKSAVDEYYSSAFAPEIPSALQFVENSKISAEMLAKYLGIEAKANASNEYTAKTDSSVFQTNLLYIEKHLEDALKSIKLSENHILFIDGIDIRPETIPFGDYLDCVKGLANAVWAINNDVFPSINDSKGRMRVVLLLRPDIFNSLGLVNRNTKLKDNSVVLNWNTKYPTHRGSDLFKLADRMFLSQQDEPSETGACWDHYFPFDAANLSAEISGRSSFVALLRYSFHRPRDILTILDTLYELYVKKFPEKRSFELRDLNSPEFRDSYSNYFLGEIRDSLSFYYNTEEFETFLKFFEYLEGKKGFTYEQFLDCYTQLTGFLAGQGKAPPSFMKNPEEFLQFLYDVNVISYIERADEERFIHWCFIDRTITNISPKVKAGLEYEIHYGLTSALNLGKPLHERQNSRSAAKREKFFSAVIQKYFPKKGFGFLEADGFPAPIFFHKTGLSVGYDVKAGDSVVFEMKQDGQGRLVATGIGRKGSR